MLSHKILKKFLVKPGQKLKLRHRDPGWEKSDVVQSLSKAEIKEGAQRVLAASIESLTQAQEMLYADDRYSLLLIFQAMDAAGKDGLIKHVMSGLNPQGTQVFSFKKPSAEELDHNFLWRCMKRLPERGRIGIYNRSYYEEVLVVKVHPELLEYQKLPVQKFNDDFWQARYDDINAFEKHLVNNGTIILKFFLHLSKKEQKKRLLDRLDNPEKHWKFSLDDLKERGHWDDYMRAYEQAITATSTKWAPWYVVPADHKWITRAIVADILCDRIHRLDLSFPKVSAEQKAKLKQAREQLQAE